MHGVCSCADVPYRDDCYSRFSVGRYKMIRNWGKDSRAPVAPRTPRRATLQVKYRWSKIIMWESKQGGHTQQHPTSVLEYPFLPPNPDLTTVQRELQAEQ